MRNRYVLLILFIISFNTNCFTVRAGDYHLLPEPQKYTPSNTDFVLGKIKLSTSVLQSEWEALIVERGGVLDKKANSAIVIKLVSTLGGVPLNQDEAYRLKVTGNKVAIEAVTERGVYWAMQTLMQLQKTLGKKVSFGGCDILDWPAFRVRGFMQDVGRSYISMDELKREIAILSKYKINVFHWHLTENQSWRLESKIFPMLNDSVNTTRMPGKYYTLEEAKELVAYCKTHQMTLIPEFHYLNHFDTFGDIIALYNSRIYNVEQGSDDIAGTIVAVWNDRKLSNERNIILENNFYPSVLAISERAWRGGGTEYFDGNGTILKSEDSPEFKAFADFEKRMLWHKEHMFKGYPFAYVKQTNLPKIKK